VGTTSREALKSVACRVSAIDSELIIVRCGGVALERPSQRGFPRHLPRVVTLRKCQLRTTHRGDQVNKSLDQTTLAAVEGRRPVFRQAFCASRLIWDGVEALMCSHREGGHRSAAYFARITQILHTVLAIPRIIVAATFLS